MQNGTLTISPDGGTTQITMIPVQNNGVTRTVWRSESAYTAEGDFITLTMDFSEYIDREINPRNRTVKSTLKVPYRVAGVLYHAHKYERISLAPVLPADAEIYKMLAFTVQDEAIIQDVTVAGAMPY